MYTLDDYSFQYSRAPESSDIPDGYFHILPFRIPPAVEGMEAIEQAKADFGRAVGKEPNVFKLEGKDARSVYFHQALVDDYALAIVSKMKLKSPIPCEFEMNKLYFDALIKLLEDHGPGEGESETTLQSFVQCLRSQTVPPLNEVTFEAYKDQRTISVAWHMVFAFAPVIHNLRISKSDQASVASIRDLCSLIIGLTNDLESFNKEFDEHSSSGSLDVIHNAMAVLMANYGYTEDEAREILKNEIISLERQLLADYEAWKTSPSYKSDDMRHFMALCIVATGGGCYAQSILTKYHGAKLSTTAEDRAQLVGRSRNSWRLHGYPPPASLKQQNPQATLCRETGSVPPSGPADILAPFEKAAAADLCMAPYNYTKSMPGKKTIAQFIECLRSWFTLPDDCASVIERVASMLFHSTLMIDDIEDDSTLRRGKPTAYLVFGKAQTVNSATYLYARATRELEQLKHPESKTAFLDELETLALGQALDLYWKFHKTCPTTSEYLTMVDNKTGGFFRLALRVMEIESGATPCPDLTHLVTLMGRYYQIRDDYLNLTSDEYTGTKGFCEDLSEGKFSFPLLHALQNSASADMIRGLLFHRENGRELSPDMKAYIVAEMKEAGSLAHTRDTVMQLHDAMMETLDKVEAALGRPNKRLKAFLLWLKL
ncbi:hypothetical protein HFD88_003773 [Aspergillus terreus]|nr:hypothetical protein HFD88_003773 [Aspergillus terreus]